MNKIYKRQGVALEWQIKGTKSPSKRISINQKPRKVEDLAVVGQKRKFENQNKDF